MWSPPRDVAPPGHRSVRRLRVHDDGRPVLRRLRHGVRCKESSAMENGAERLEALEAEVRCLRADTAALERRWRARCALAWAVSLCAPALLCLPVSNRAHAG